MTKIIFLGLLGLLVFSAIAAPIFAQADLYAGKTLLVVIGTDAGGNGDPRTKAILPAF